MSDRISALATLLSTVEYDDVGSDIWYGVVSDKRKLFESESKKKDDDCIDSGITTTSPPHGGKEQHSSMQQQDQLRAYKQPAFIHQSPLEQQFQLGVEPDRKLTSSSMTRKDETCASNSIATEAIPTSRKNASTLICLVSLGCHDRRQSSNQNRSLSWLTTRKVSFAIVDGNDVTARDIRDELFEISGIRGNYPQFFIERHDGQIEYFGDFDRMETLNETSGLPAEVLEMHPELETWADITFESTNIDDEVTEAGNRNVKHSSALKACDNTDGDSAGIQSTDPQLTVNDSTAATSLSCLHSDPVDNNNSNSGEDSSQRLYLQPNILDQFAESLSDDEVHTTGIHADEEFDNENGGKADEVEHDIKTTINRDVYRTLKKKTKPIVKTAVRPSLNVQVNDLENMANGVFSPRTPRGIISQKAQSIRALEASPSSHDSRIVHGLKSSEGVSVMLSQSPSSRMRLALSPRSTEGKAATASAQLIYNNKVVKENKYNIPKSPRSKPPQSPRIVGTKTYINTPHVAESPRSLLQEGIASFDTADFCHDFDEDDTDNEEKDTSTSTANVDRSLHTPKKMNINISECDDQVDEKMIVSKSKQPRTYVNEVNIIVEEEALNNNNLHSVHQMWQKQMQLTACIIERFQNDVGSFKTMMNQDGGNDKEGEDLLVAAARLAKSLDRFMTKTILQGKQDEAHQSKSTRLDADVASSCNEQGESTPTGIEKQHPTPPKPDAYVFVTVKDSPASDDHRSLFSSLRASPKKLKEKSKLEINIDGFPELNPCEKQEDIFFMAAEPSPCHGDDKSLFSGSTTKRTKNKTHMWNSPAKNILQLFGIVATKNDKEDASSFHSLSSK